MIPKLLTTARDLLRGLFPRPFLIRSCLIFQIIGNENGKLIVSYVPRKRETTEALHQYLKEMKWAVSEIDWRLFTNTKPPLDAQMFIFSPFNV